MSSVTLIVEDSAVVVAAYQDWFEQFGHPVVVAITQAGAREILAARNDIVCIVVDGNVPNQEGLVPQPTTPLVEEIAASGFDGPIIAMTGDDNLLEPLRRFGCTHVFSKTDTGSVFEIKTILDSL